jgi:hypothetical protein
VEPEQHFGRYGGRGRDRYLQLVESRLLLDQLDRRLDFLPHPRQLSWQGLAAMALRGRAPADVDRPLELRSLVARRALHDAEHVDVELLPDARHNGRSHGAACPALLAGSVEPCRGSKGSTLFGGAARTRVSS